MRSLASKLRRFGRDENGAVVAEAVVMLPLLIWAYLALFVYWDAYRSINTSQKAAYTISDMISREMNTTSLTPAYITGMRSVMTYLVDTDQTVKLRVSQITWSETNHRYEVSWSVSPSNAFTPLTTATVSSITDSVPTLADGDFVIVVETEVSYKPLLNGFGWILDLNGLKPAYADYTANGRFAKTPDLADVVVVQKLDTMALKQFVVTRPRFTPKLCMTGFTCS